MFGGLAPASRPSALTHEASLLYSIALSLRRELELLDPPPLVATGWLVSTPENDLGTHANTTFLVEELVEIMAINSTLPLLESLPSQGLLVLHILESPVVVSDQLPGLLFPALCTVGHLSYLDLGFGRIAFVLPIDTGQKAISTSVEDDSVSGATGGIDVPGTVPHNSGSL